MDPELIKNIVKSTNEIRKKYKALKRGRDDTEKLLEETFRPISQPLKELKNKSEEQIENKIKSKIEKELSFPKYEKLQDTTFETPENTILVRQLPQLESTPISKVQRISHDSLGDDSIENVSLHSYYTNEYMKGHRIDNAYGPKYNAESKKFKLGRHDLQFDGNSISIGGKNYKATRGLYELIFMKKPSLYTPEDLENYQNIILLSNVFRKDVYDNHSQIKGNGGQKYRQIISKLIPKHQGKGLMQLTHEKPNYVYWDDPNELVDRLRLLLASQQAGHNNHNNEIISIIEELKEAGIII